MVIVEGCRRYSALPRLFHLRQQERWSLLELKDFRRANGSGMAQSKITLSSKEEAQKRREPFKIFKGQELSEMQIKRSLEHILLGKGTPEEVDCVRRHMDNIRFFNVIPERDAQRA